MKSRAAGSELTRTAELSEQEPRETIKVFKNARVVVDSLDEPQLNKEESKDGEDTYSTPHPFYIEFDAGFRFNSPAGGKFTVDGDNLISGAKRKPSPSPEDEQPDFSVWRK